MTRARLLLKHTSLLCLLTLFLPANAYSQRLKMVIGGAEFRTYPVAAPSLRLVGESQSEEAKTITAELSNLLQSNIALARSLNLVPPRTYLAPTRESLETPKFMNWVNVGASGLIRGSVTHMGSTIKLSLRFFDVIGKRQLVGREFEVAASGGAWAIHRFLDQVIKNLTGELGIFSTQIAYVKRTPKGKALYTSDVDGQNERQVTDAATLSLLPAWDHKGENIFFTSYLRGNPDLYRINLQTKKLQWLSNKRGLNTGAAISPNGSKIALTLSIDGNTEIYVMNADGTALTRLTDSWGQDVSPTWSPDGKKIAFVSSRSGNPHIYSMNANGSNPQRLTFRGTYNQEPDWSPHHDGQIAFTARDEYLKYDIFLIDPNTKAVSRLTQNAGNNESPSFSPDGQHISFTSTRPPRQGKKLYIMDVDGRHQRRISRTPGDYETPSWGPRQGY